MSSARQLTAFAGFWRVNTRKVEDGGTTAYNDEHSQPTERERTWSVTHDALDTFRKLLKADLKIRNASDEDKGEGKDKVASSFRVEKTTERHGSRRRSIGGSLRSSLGSLRSSVSSKRNVERPESSRQIQTRPDR